jgi:putative ABC transport system substrate-binding protein
MRRREFITLIGGAATVWPLTARAQTSTKPTIGYLSSRSSSNSADIIAAFRKGLNEAGFTEGQNVSIESRFAEGNFDRLPALTADLLALKVNVVVATGGTVSVVKAKGPLIIYRIEFFSRWGDSPGDSQLIEPQGD